MSDPARLSVRIERRFDVPPETVFDTLTDPELMPVWWGEAEFDIDLRVGGHWQIVRWDGETKYLAKGEYLDVERPSRLRYTYAMPQFSPNSDTITVQIAAVDGGSSLVFEHSGEDIASELRGLSPGEASPSETGWQQGFDLMAAAWKKG